MSDLPPSGSKELRHAVGNRVRETGDLLKSITPEKVEDKMLFEYLAEALLSAARHLHESEGILTIKSK